MVQKLKMGHNLLCMEPWTADKKKLLACVAVPPAPVRVPSQRPLALSAASVTSVANDKGDNEVILGLGTGLLALALQLRKTPENFSKNTVLLEDST